MNWNIRNSVSGSLLVLLCLLLFPKITFAAPGSSTILGSTFDVSNQIEINLWHQVSGNITSFSNAAGYNAYNWYGDPTNRSNIYQAASGVGQPNSITFYSGEGNLENLYYAWDGHYFISGSSSGEKVYDEDIYPYTGARNTHFVYLWSCEQGDCVGDWYNYIYKSAPYGMPLCWLHLNTDIDVSADGYACPDGKGYTFAGFCGAAPYLTYDKLTQDGSTQPFTCFNFLLDFYKYALKYGYYYSINDALNLAATAVWNENFGDCVLHKGYTITDVGTGVTHSGNMVIYGDGSMHISGSGQPPPMRCPFIYTWDGQRYMIDNNLLPTSLKNNGTDVQDYYKLEQSLVPTAGTSTFSLYQLQIAEFENEHSYIDQVKLLAVDHSTDCNIAVTPEGKIVTYRRPSPPFSCVDNNGTNRLSQIELIDGNVSNPTTYFDGYKGDYLVANFGQVTSQNAKLILRDDRKCYDTGAYPPCCIQIQILNNSQWQTVSVVAPREYWATEAVNLSPYVVVGQDLAVRLYWTMPHRLDYVGLDTTPQESFEIHYASLISATHSADGNVLGKLLKNDGVYAELVPGQQIQLAFLMPNNHNQNEKRTFIFYTEGHYNTIS